MHMVKRASGDDFKQVCKPMMCRNADPWHFGTNPDLRIRTFD